MGYSHPYRLTTERKLTAMKDSHNWRIRLAAPAALLILLGGCSAQEAPSQQAQDAGSSRQEPESLEAQEAESSSGEALALLIDTATTQYFTGEAPSEEDIETILTAGVNAPSAMNGQPWHFSAVTDSALLERIAEDMSAGMPAGAAPAASAGDEAESSSGTEGGSAAPSKAGIADAPLAVVISCPEGSEFDAGLSCQAMSSAAQLLGYGTKIISSPTIALNGESQAEYRELLGIPQDYSAVAVLLVGYADDSIDESADGYTGATSRSPMEELTTYVTPAQ